MNKFKAFILKHKASLIFVIFLSIVFVLYKYTSLFEVNNISVSTLDNSKFLNLQEGKLNERLKKYKNKKYFEIDTTVVTNEIEKESLYIKKVVVEKIFPNRLSVKVVERIPFIVVNFSTKCVVLDIENFVLDITETNCKEGQISSTIFVESDDIKYQFEKGSISSYNQLSKILNTVKVLHEYNFPIKKVIIEKNVADFVIENNKLIRISFDGDLNEQLARLVSVFIELGKSNYKYNVIDVRFERPVIKYL